MTEAVLSSHSPNLSPNKAWDQAAILQRLKPVVREAFATADSLDAARAFTRRLAREHYENFSVVSFLLPRRFRQDFCNIYAFCRVADDLGDELGDAPASLRQLARLREQTRSAFDGSPQNNLFVALADTVARHQMPAEPFFDLISAFEQDQTITRYETREQVLDYCRRSANPVGRLVLMMCGYHDAERLALSDQTCTALQLVNFWQDVRRDLLDRDRIYIPADALREQGLTEADLREQIDQGRCDERFRALIKLEVDAANRMFDVGRRLLPMLHTAVRGQVTLFGAGGMAISRAIARQDCDTISRRPVLSGGQKSRLIGKALVAAAVIAAADVGSILLRPFVRSGRTGALR